MPKRETDTVWIYTDGSSQQHSGGSRTSGWAAVLICDDIARVIAGNQRKGTNNEMEALAVLKALQALKRPCIVFLNTDSQYVEIGLNKIAAGEPLFNSNRHVWQQIKEEYKRHLAVRVEKIKAHADDLDVFNDLCDKLSRRAARGKLTSFDRRGKASELLEKAPIAG